MALVGRQASLLASVGVAMHGVTGGRQSLGTPLVATLRGELRSATWGRVIAVLGARWDAFGRGESGQKSLGIDGLLWAGLAVQLGSRESEYNGWAGRGWIVAAQVRELGGYRGVELGLGYSIDIGWLSTANFGGDR